MCSSKRVNFTFCLCNLSHFDNSSALVVTIETATRLPTVEAVGLKLITTEKNPLTFPLNFALSSPSFLPTASVVPGPATLCCKDSGYVSIEMEVWVRVKKISIERRFTMEVPSNCYLSIIENKITF